MMLEYDAMIGGFRSFLDVREYPAGGKWVLLAPLEYQGNQHRFTVPRGFTTDFASVPSALQSFVSVVGAHTKPAVLHDWLYRVQPSTVTRKDADALFRRAMRDMGVGLMRRNMAYAAVRAGGWRMWQRYAQLNREAGKTWET